MGITLNINDIRSLTNEMARYENLDYTGCSFSFLKRRLSHVFSELKVRKLTQFTERLGDDIFRDNIKYFMAVNVTEMFRDPGFWRSLRTNVFPLLQENHITFWFPDAASGEEIFSLVILLQEDGLMEKVVIICDHRSAEKCREISLGILDAGKMELNHTNYRRLEEHECFEDYFSGDGEHSRIRSELLKNVRIRTGSFMPDDDEEEVGIIIFRNSCINYTYQYREKVLKEMFARLKPGGIIALGVKESVPAVLADSLVPVDKSESIYRKAGAKKS